MDNKNALIRQLIALLVVACLAGVAGYFIGKTTVDSPDSNDSEALYALNRASMEKLGVEEGTIYVIGHRSPDTDTVCSAIAYARFLNLLGYDAEAAITEQVNKETAYVLEQAHVEVPPILEDAGGENIFLVDHSEYAQAVEGLEDANIVGILDHHGVGTVSTGQQIAYEAKPIGSTATIIWLDYLNYGFDIDETTAYLLLCSVLSDTDNLFGSTTTEADRKAVDALAELAKVSDVDALYLAIHTEKLSYEGFSDQEILFSDYKEYEAGSTTFGIGLVNAIDEDTAAELAERMKEALPEGFATHDVDLMYAAVSIRENGEKIDYIVPCDEYSQEVFEAAFPDYDEFNGTAYIFRTGLGRKTLFVPGLTDFLEAHPHE